MVKKGIKGHGEIVVTAALSAEKMGSGVMDVFATPAMLALMENTAYKSVLPYLNEGCGTVGTKVDIEHMAASPVGMKVECDTELIEVDASDEKGLIGKGTHERFIIESEKFREKTYNKLKKDAE